MKRGFILFFTFNLFISLHAQEVNEKLHRAQCFAFRNAIYVSGYTESDKGVVLKTIRYNGKGEKTNEITKDLGKGKPADLYPPNFDTTHGFVSLILQKTNNEKTALLLRYSEFLTLRSSDEKAEITRINSFAAFDNEKLYYKNQLYVVREAKDSAGRFYFFRYDLRDSSALFNYNFKWQFNFDQHLYHRIHPVYATADHVYLYVNCLDGDKKGQWILLFNTEDGTMTKAIKLNKNDNEICFVSKLEVHGSNEDMALAGVKYPAPNVDLKNGRFSMNYQSAKRLNTFFCEVDSSGEVKTQLDNFLPVPNDLLKEKELKEFLFRCNALERTESGFNLNYECLYKGKDGIYRSYGFLLSNLISTPEGLLKAENNSFLPCYRNDKSQPKGKTGNPNSKVTANQYDNDKAQEADRLFYKNAFVNNFTQAAMNISASKKTASILSFFNNKKTGSLEFYKYSMKNYVWDTSSLKNTSDYSRYNVFSMEDRFVIFTSLKDESGFSLSFIEP